MAPGRDDLTINAHGLKGVQMPTMLESADASSLIEDWIDQSSNLPLELKRMQDEILERKQRIEELLKIINQRDSSLQRWIRVHGSHVPNPKEPEYRKVIIETQGKIRQLLDENVKQGMETKRILDKRILAMDKGVKKLIERGELQEDPELPSLLRPENPPQTDGPTDLMSSAFLPTSTNGASTNSYRTAGRSATGISNGQRAIPQQTSTGQQNHQATIPTISAIPAAVITQRARESSAGASNKRPRLAGNLAIPQVSGNLARQSSLGPGTPKGSHGSTSRAGSAGPRPPKTGSAVTKKVGPPSKGSSARKSNLGKSSISRVKRAHGGSPSSTNDSEHSDGDSASPDDDDPSTPPVDRHGDTVMVDGEEEDADDKKYCTCQSTSFGDMVACDNDKCPYEWFHWGCVGITRAPVDSWFCNTPACNRTLGIK